MIKLSAVNLFLSLYKVAYQPWISLKYFVSLSAFKNS